jgi:hypothetical protein
LFDTAKSQPDHSQLNGGEATVQGVDKTMRYRISIPMLASLLSKTPESRFAGAVERKVNSKGN